MKDIIYAILSEEKACEFAKWAFGDDFTKLGDHCGKGSFFQAWNDRHNEVLKLKRNSEIKEDIPKMIALWKQSIDKIHNE